jgi:homoserine dehydrogenase
MEKAINVGIVGMGVVGTGVAKIILNQGHLLSERTGKRFVLKTAVDLDWEQERGVDLAGVQTTTDFEALVTDPEIDVVVETVGGIEPAFTMVRRALATGKHVVTANKALLAMKGRTLFQEAEDHGVELRFEASVGGGIPIIKSLREGLVANKIMNMYGIINGTSNYILTRMHREGLDFDAALREAQIQGFAEADPTLDVGGGDAAHKLTILASLAAGGFVDFNAIPVEGITELTTLDIDFAKNFGYVVKLLAIYRFNEEKLDLRVHPTLVPGDHLLAAVNNELNAVFITGDYVGDTMFYGPGAGQTPTASAIVSDLVDLASILQAEKVASIPTINPAKTVNLFSLEEITNRFYLRLFTLDQPGILAQIAGVFGKYGISISSVVQLETHGDENYVPIVLLTHEASEKAMFKAMMAIKEFPFVRPDILRLRLFK